MWKVITGKRLRQFAYDVNRNTDPEGLNTYNIVVMHKTSLKVLLALLLLSPLWVQAVTVSVRVSNNNDDAEQDFPTGNTNRGSTDLELAYDGNQAQIIGMRFLNINVPPNVFITDAYIQFTVDETDSGTTNLRVIGQASDNPTGFSGNNNDISNRPQTSAVLWNNVPPWTTVGAATVDQRTPNIATIVQQIIDRPGWSGGNDMVMMIEPGSGCLSSACQRTAESRNGSSGRAPLLVIEYVATVPNTADLGVTQTDSVDPANTGDVVNYTITVSNNGPLVADNVMVNNPLPSGVTFVSASASQGSCSLSGSILNCNVGTLNSGTNATVNLVVTMPGFPTTVTNTVNVSSNQNDANSGNNSSSESTTVTALNTDQLCYLVADSGGANGGDDLLTRLDTSGNSGDTPIGSGTGTNNIEAIAWRADTGVLYGANADRLGRINLTSGVFTGLPQTFGTGGGSAGNVNFSDTDGLAWDSTTGMLFGSHSRGGNDLLFLIDPSTGAHIPNAFGAGIDYVEIQAIGGNNITDDIAVDPTTGVMYASVNSGGTTDRLIIINKSTGATTDVSAITVPDIEGLGTDEYGQLWGVSGTQNILYEINKNTGVGFNPRTLGSGSDYEAIDCYSRSPSTVADILVEKTVSAATPAPADNIDYTISVTNSGTGDASILQISDELPSGVTFVSATPATGSYDENNGVWFIGSLSVGSTTTLIINVNVDNNTASQTITNTASVLSLFQTDPISANDSDSVEINVQGPMLTTLKSSMTLSDPYTVSGNPKAIPGAMVQYSIQVDNNGSGPTDTDTIVIRDAIPAFNALVVANFDAGNPGPVAFIDGPIPSGVSYSFVSLGNAADSLQFSNDGGATYTYTPVDGGTGFDASVTHIQIQLSGALFGNTGAARRFILRFKTHIL